MVEDGLAVGCTQVLDDGFPGPGLRERGIRLLDTSYRRVMDLSCNLLALARGGWCRRARRAAERGACGRGIEVLDPTCA
jgi:hypothetical protein